MNAAREQLADIRDDSFTIASGLEPDQSRFYEENLDSLVIGETLAKREKWRQSIDLLKINLPIASIVSKEQ